MDTRRHRGAASSPLQPQSLKIVEDIHCEHSEEVQFQNTKKRSNGSSARTNEEDTADSLQPRKDLRRQRNTETQDAQTKSTITKIEGAELTERLPNKESELRNELKKIHEHGKSKKNKASRGKPLVTHKIEITWEYKKNKKNKTVNCKKKRATTVPRSEERNERSKGTLRLK